MNTLNDHRELFNKLNVKEYFPGIEGEDFFNITSDRHVYYLTEGFELETLEKLRNFFKKHNSTEFVFLKPTDIDIFNLPNVKVMAYPYIQHHILMRLMPIRKKFPDSIKSKAFTVFSGSGSDPTRRAFLSALDMFGLLNKGHYSLGERRGHGFKKIPANGYSFNEKFLEAQDNIKEQLLDYDFTDCFSEYAHEYNYKNIQPYMSDSWFYIALENHFNCGYEFPAEKSWWGYFFGVPTMPIINKQQFSQFTDIYGFKEYELMEPLDYDVENNNYIDVVLKHIEKIAFLANLPVDFWADYYYNNKDIIEHNKNHFPTAADNLLAVMNETGEKLTDLL